MSHFLGCLLHGCVDDALLDHGHREVRRVKADDNLLRAGFLGLLADGEGGLPVGAEEADKIRVVAHETLDDLPVIAHEHRGRDGEGRPLERPAEALVALHLVLMFSHRGNPDRARLDAGCGQGFQHGLPGNPARQYVVRL